MPTIDRSKWPIGPWDDEPDLVEEPPMLLYRQSNGAWAALIAIPKEHINTALGIKHHLTQVKLFGDRHLEIVTECKHPAADPSATYVGFFFSEVGDVRPNELHWLDDLPDYLTGTYEAVGYVTLKAARNIADQLYRVLRTRNVFKVDRPRQAMHI